MDINKTFDFYDTSIISKYNIRQTMEYQLNMLDNLDAITKRHSENVANVTMRLCEYLGYKKEFTLYATICAYLHDIGKLRIPKSILFKNGRLTDEEYKIIQNHTIYGYEICMKDPKLQPFSEGCLYHHENLDGSGYPNGVSGSKIPKASQIIHVADVYDALVIKRHYTTHVDISSMLKELINDSEPSKNTIALDQLATSFKFGKINKKALNALFQVVLDDTYFEIHSTKEYIKSLEFEKNRLEQIAIYDNKMQKKSSEKGKEFYKNGINLLLSKNETLDNYKQVLVDYENAIAMKNHTLSKLKDEIKILKKLKV
jgi:hypothetical protein